MASRRWSSLPTCLLEQSLNALLVRVRTTDSLEDKVAAEDSLKFCIMNFCH